MLDDFLNFAKIRKLHRAPTDLNAEIAETLDFFEPEAAGPHVEIIRYLDPDLPRVMLDAGVVPQARCINLLLNAKQAMPTEGQFVVRTTTVGGNVILLI